MTELRIVGDAIEMGGQGVATLVPGLRLSDRDKVEAAFDSLSENEDSVAELEDLLEQKKNTSRCSKRS
jgi:hypothetical protein